MNSIDKSYFFKNDNSLLTQINYKDDYNEIFYIILSQINDYLSVMTNNNISNAALNFDNLICVEVINSNIVSDIIKFNIDTLQFNGSTGNVYNISNHNNYIFNCVKTKLQHNSNTTYQNKEKPIVINNHSQVSNQIDIQKPKYTSKLQHIDAKVIDLNIKPVITESEQKIKDNLKQIDSIIKNNVINNNDFKIEPYTEIEKVKVNDNKLQQMGSVITECDDEIKIDNNPEQLLKMIQTLTELKNKENNKLETLRLTAEKEEEKLNELSNEFGDKRRDHFKNKEKEKENKNMFIANKKAYYLIKQDIEDCKITEAKISVLFKDYYPIYKFMDLKQLLDTDDEYIEYVKIYNELYPKQTFNVDSYVPHNIHYLNDIEQSKYDNIKCNKDMIETFIENNTSSKNNEIPKKRKSLEDVLLGIDNDTFEEEHNDFDSITFDLDDTS